MANAFADNGHVQVCDGTTIALCEEFLALADSLPKSCWTQVIRTKGVTSDYLLCPRDERIDGLHAAARREAVERLFSYSFARIDDSEANGRFPEWVKMREMLASPVVTQLIMSHTGQMVSTVDMVYVNCFRYGDFLTTHTDSGGKSKIAAAFSLTRSWDPADGGCTYVLAGDRKTVVDTVNPSLGSILLMDVCHMKVPHYVSEVTRVDVGVNCVRKSLIARYS
jgi:hypothetical protein